MNLPNRLIDFPDNHFKRHIALKPYFKISFNQLVRDGTEKRLCELEEHVAAQKRRFSDEKAARDAKKPSRGIKGAINYRPPPPSRTASLERLITAPFTPAPTVQVHDADDELYERAARILLGDSDPTNVRKRAEAAVGLVRKERSLTAPSESEILARLEENYRRIKSEPAPTTQSYDTFVGTIVDLDKVKTAGEPIE